MLDALKPLLESNVISEEVRAEIEQAWNEKILENKQKVTVELREEFAQKYEHDKKIMIESISEMMEERLHAEIQEFVEDRKQLAEQKAKYSRKMREDSNKLQKFVLNQLHEEVSELHNDQKLMAENFTKLEEFVVEALAKEIAEFYEDKKDLAETKVRLVKEAKQKFKEIKEGFVKSSAKLVSETTEKVLRNEIAQLKDDINEARKNDFGRKLFEAFANEYANSHLNEKSETAKLLKVVKMQEKKLEEAKVERLKTERLAEAELKKTKSQLLEAQRQALLTDLIAPLNSDQKSIMKDLLETVQTDRLKTQFDKYLPAVIDGKTPAKRKALNEGKEITGNKKTNNNSSEAVGENVVDIRRLAGLN